MPRRAATFPRVTAFDRRAVPTDYRRAVCRTVGIGVGTVTTAGTIAGTAAVAAAWMVSTALNGAPHFKTTPLALEMAALSQSGSERIITAFADLAAAPVRSNDAAAPAPPAVETRAAEAEFHPPLPRPRTEPSVQAQREAAAAPAKPALPQAAAARSAGRVAAAPNWFDPEPLSALAPAAAPARPAPLPPAQVSERTDAAPAPRDTAAPPAKSAPAQVAAATPAPPRTWLAPDGHTAIYDIVAHTVYMPDGMRLEAHSGLGGSMDDPRAVRERARGPTPPNVYNPVLRDGVFHGVQAIRMNPVDDVKMFGRAGILAHPYMLGPSGQSFGCVSFKNYAEFLQAFEQGKVDRMIVVTHLPDRDERRLAVNEL
jgi:hypothetical protein